jgi:polar amino acid transport system substrate-binding protein
VKQLSQNMQSGQLRVEEVPAPEVLPGRILVQTAYSLISAGTERSLVETGRKSLVGKALSRPDQVRKVLRSVQQLGLQATFRLVKSRLDARMPLGYSAAGVVLAVGTGVDGFKAGDWVACGGAAAGHAEVMSVPRNLCVKVPEGVSLSQAAFTTVGAIALQGIRLADVRLGEVVLVMGLGLLGNLTVQMLKASGCRVVGYDPDPQRCELALKLGADHAFAEEKPLESTLAHLSASHGADAVIITASTSSSHPVEMAGELCRDKGKVIVVGAVGLTLPRAPYYNKEISFGISRSYGPGRYDLDYEEKGKDYPYGYVRWTEGRNMQAFLGLLQERKVDVDSLVTHTFALEQALDAYDLISGKRPAGSAPADFMGVLFAYPLDEDLTQNAASKAASLARRVLIAPVRGKPALAETETLKVGVIGAGNFARSMLLPHLKGHPSVTLAGVATLVPLESRDVAERFGFAYAATDPDEILHDPSIRAVIIATRHDSHADLVVRALLAGKAVHVEKPLAMTPVGLEAVLAAYQPQAELSPFLMVGFNRRFAPLVRQAADFFAGRGEPLAMSFRINAGYLPLDHWTQDLEIGGGRIVGEVCHFLDLFQFLAGARLTSVAARALPNQGRYRDDNVAITATLADGSVGNVLYVANGDKAQGKEYLEIFGEGRSAVMDDYQSLALYRGRKQVSRQGARDKGHRGEMLAWVEAIRSAQNEPVPFDQAVAATQATFAVLQSLANGQVVSIENTSL